VLFSCFRISCYFQSAIDICNKALEIKKNCESFYARAGAKKDAGLVLVMVLLLSLMTLMFLLQLLLLLFWGNFLIVVFVVVVLCDHCRCGYCCFSFRGCYYCCHISFLCNCHI
jgi:hypothetical protein